MQVETKLKHAAIVIDSLVLSLGAAIVDYAADCGLVALDFFVSHRDDDLSSRGAQRRGDLQAVTEGLLRFARNDVTRRKSIYE